MVRNRAVYLFGYHCGFLGVNDCILKKYLYKFIIDTLCDTKYDQEAKSLAANGLKTFCETYGGQNIPSPIIQSIYNIYYNSLKNGDLLNIKQQTLIIIGLTTIFTGFDDEKEIEQSINYMIQIPYKQLCILTHSNKTKQQKKLKANNITIVETMKRLSTIFKHFRINNIFRNNADQEMHVSLKALLKMWPQIEYLLINHTKEDDVMEYSIRCLKHVIRECFDDYKNCQLFIPVFKQIINLYCNVSQRSSFLYILSIYLDEYASSNETIAELFSKSLYQITAKTFKIAKDEKSFIDNHELIEDFYELIKVYFRKCGAKFVFENNMSCIKWMFEMGINGLLMKNVDAHTAVISFYQQIFDISGVSNADFVNNLKPSIDRLYFKYDESLINKILCGLCGKLKNESRAKELAELMNDIYGYNQNHCQILMKQQLENIMIDNDEINDNNNKQQMIMLFCGSISKKERVRTLVNWYNTCKSFNGNRSALLSYE